MSSVVKITSTLARTFGRAFTQGDGVPSNALLLNGQPILLNGQYITLTKAT